MKTLLTLLLIAPFITMMAQPKVSEIKPVPNGEISYSGNLSNGTVLNDLSWAWSSQNACFPETQKKKSPWAREYYISKDCLKANLQSKNFTDISKQVDYNGKIYALTEDLS